MGVIFRMALRNLSQHKAKTVIIGLFICIGVMIVNLGNAFLESTNRGLEKDFRANYTGDIVVAGKFADNTDFDMFGVNSVSVGERKPLPAINDIEKVQAIVDGTKGIDTQTKSISSMGYFRTDAVGDDFDPDDDAQMEIPYFFLFGVDTSTYFKTFNNMHITEGTYPSATENEVLVDVRIKEKFAKYYKIPLNLGDSVLLSAMSAAGTTREAKVCGFYEQPDKNSAMTNLVYSTPSLARAFADLTYGAGYAEELPQNIDTKIGTLSEDDLFGGSSNSDATVASTSGSVTGSTSSSDDDMFGDSSNATSDDDMFANSGDDMFSTDTSVMSAKDVSFDDILGDTTLRDKLNQTDDGAWNFIILKTNATTNVTKTIATLNKEFKDAGLEAQALDWKNAAATFASTVQGISTLFTALVVILAIVVFIIIMNTLTVSVIERTGEIGTMRALGASKGFVRKLFFTESISITLLSAAGGTIIALLIMVIFNAFHLSVTGDIAKMILGGGSIKFIPTLTNILGTILLVAIGSSLANLYPVSAALKISPLKALSQDGE